MGIREDLKLTGTKFGCGGGYCGACTVHINGEAMRSCRIRVGDVENAIITTIEGLDAASNHPVQEGLVRSSSSAMRILSVWSNNASGCVAC